MALPKQLHTELHHDDWYALVNHANALQAELAALKAQYSWRDISTAPSAQSVLLYCNKNIPLYAGMQRYGKFGEPQKELFRWRCDSSGHFATPTHWVPLPPPPCHCEGADMSDLHPELCLEDDGDIGIDWATTERDSLSMSLSQSGRLIVTVLLAGKVPPFSNMVQIAPEAYKVLRKLIPEEG